MRCRTGQRIIVYVQKGEAACRQSPPLCVIHDNRIPAEREFCCFNNLKSFQCE